MAPLAAGEPPASSGSSSLNTDSDFEANARSVVAIVVILLVGSVANAAGVGGGAIFIPILQALVGFGLKDATAVSQALITAGAIVGVLMNMFKRSPLDPDAPLINFSAALSLTPVVLAGVAIGVLLNTMLPVTIITLLLLVFMAIMLLQTTAKALHMWAAESARARSRELAAAHAAGEVVLHVQPPSEAGAAASAYGTPRTSLTGRGSQQFDLKPLPGAGAASWLARIPIDAFDSWDCLEGDMSAFVAQPPPPSDAMGRAQSAGGYSDVSDGDRWDSHASLEGAGVPPRLRRSPSLLARAATARAARADATKSRKGRPTPRTTQRRFLAMLAGPGDGLALTADQGTPGGTRPPPARTPRGLSGGRLVFVPGGPLARITENMALDGVGDVFVTQEQQRGAHNANKPPAAGDSSWISRRSRWRSHLLHMGDELGGGVGPSPGLLSRATSLRTTTSSPRVTTSQGGAGTPPSSETLSQGTLDALPAAKADSQGSGSPRHPPRSPSRPGPAAAVVAPPPGPSHQPAAHAAPPAAPQRMVSPFEAMTQGLAPVNVQPPRIKLDVLDAGGAGVGEEAVVAAVLPPPAAGVNRRLPPVQPPLPPEDALDILQRLDGPPPPRMAQISPPPQSAESSCSTPVASWLPLPPPPLPVAQDDATSSADPGVQSDALLSRPQLQRFGSGSIALPGVQRTLSAELSVHASTQPWFSAAGSSAAGSRLPTPLDVAPAATEEEGEDAAAAASGTEADHADLGEGPPPSWLQVAKSYVSDVGAIMLSDLRLMPWRTVAVLAGSWAAFSALQAVRAVLPKCSVTGWALLAAQLSFMLLISLATALAPRYWGRVVRYWARARGKPLPRSASSRQPAGSGRAPSLGAPLLIASPKSMGAGSSRPAAFAPSVDGSRGGCGSPAGGSRDGAVSDGTNGVAHNPGTTSIHQLPEPAAGGGTVVADTGGDVGHAPRNPDIEQGAVHDDGKEAPVETGAEEDSGEPQWATSVLGSTVTSATITLSVAGLAGLIGGLLGLGGGMLIGPMLLELGFHPQITSATSSLTVLFSSSAALLGFIMLGRLNVQYSLVLGAASAVASVLGISVVSDLVRRSGRLSVVVFALALVMLTALVCVATFGLLKVVQEFNKGDALAITSLC